ncbi:Crp/Fnr family transcriptional regulator [Marinifilum sp.]|uniref:Crp/Fnr family transcriptional regulator n=1 Tax=Marinifilum sp. TaxID=2033137 RepID=UPI003BA90919
MIKLSELITDATGIPVDSMNKFDFEPNSNLLEFEKNDHVPKEIVKPNYFCIVLEGTVQLYWLEKYNKQTIIDFKRAGNALRPAIEIDQEKCGDMKAKFLSKGKLIAINRDYLCSITFKDDKISDLYYKLLTQDLSSTYLQLKMLKEESIEKRYLNFIEEYGDIYNGITDRMIANYLGVHYTTLSRMKVRLLEKQRNPA